MRKEYMKPAIDMAASASEQTLLVGTNKNNWAEAKENSFDEEEDTALDRIKNLEFPHTWEDADAG